MNFFCDFLIFTFTFLLDYSVRARQHFRRNCHRDLFGGFEIDDRFESCCLVDGKVGGLGLFSIFSFQCFNVGQVLRPRGGEFVLDQMFSGEHSHGLIGEFGTYSVGPSFFEPDAVDRGQHIDAYRFHADLKNEAGCGKVVFRQVMQRGAEGAKGFDDSPGVFRCRTHPKVEILGRSNMPMRGQGVGADQEKVNLPGVEFC
jgi:hypothetical protein